MARFKLDGSVKTGYYKIQKDNRMLTRIPIVDRRKRLGDRQMNSIIRCLDALMTLVEWLQQ